MRELMNKRLFRWAAATSWISETEAMLREAGDGVAQQVRQGPPWMNLAADVEWLGAILGSRDAAAALLQALVHRFLERYDAVLAFHAGRPADARSYLRHGLLLASPERLIADAEEVFCHSAGSRVSREQLRAALGRQDLSLIDGRLGFNLDARFLLECDTFYMLYGSHFLLGLAVQLQREAGVDFKPALRARGIATLASCRVPVSIIPLDGLEQLCCQTIRCAFGPDRARMTSPPRVPFDFTVCQPIGPEQLTACEHPSTLADSLYR